MKVEKLLLGPVIDHLSFLQVRFQNVNKRGVFGVLEVNVAIGFGMKGQQEAMSKSVGQSFGAVVDTKLKIGHCGNFAGQRTKNRRRPFGCRPLNSIP